MSQNASGGRAQHRRRITTLWESLRASYWFVPALMAAVAAVAAIGMTQLDRRVGGDWVYRVRWLYQGGADGAREVLSTTATAMLGVAGVTFSVTIVALTLAANQFGPRLLRTFMRDRGNQAALGTFVATFLYCLLVLRSIHGDNDDLDRFVPHLAVSVAVVLAVASLGVLIYFIHHVAAVIQAPNVVAAVADELDHAINRLYPQDVGQGLPEEAARLDALRSQVPPETSAAAGGPTEVRSEGEGYVQRVDEDGLVRRAREHDVMVRVEARPSRFIAEGDVLLTVWGLQGAGDQVCGTLRNCVVLGPQRSLAQDVLFPVDQLAEMAVRALSPSTNDPYTAAQCVERLGVALARWAGRPVPTPYRGDADGRLRVIAHATTLPEALAAAYDAVRDHARGDAMVLSRLAEALQRLAVSARRPEDRRAVLDHAAALDRTVGDAMTGDSAADPRGRHARVRGCLADRVLVRLREPDG